MKSLLWNQSFLWNQILCCSYVICIRIVHWCPLEINSFTCFESISVTQVRFKTLRGIPGLYCTITDVQGNFFFRKFAYTPLPIYFISYYWCKSYIRLNNHEFTCQKLNHCEFFLFEHTSDFQNFICFLFNCSDSESKRQDINIMRYLFRILKVIYTSCFMIIN